ncbi:unnamed protein product [Schistosoma turkestanicum]|nr:unnamed protein product [Schistosoma turkestanicum]
MFHKLWKLAERVINAAITLSDRKNIAYPERIYDKETGENVDRCWTYISQLSEAIQFHIAKSHEYHKFHHEIWSARMEIQQVLSSYSLIQEKLGALSLLTDEALITIKSMIESQLSIYTRLSQKSKEFLAKSSVLKSIFLRNSLTHGKHSAYLLASLRLPSGQLVHRGDSVKVWGSNQFLSKLHNEWNVEVSNGEQIKNAPSICFWLTSPEHSPASENRNDLESSDNEENHEVFGKISSTKSICKRFHKDLYSSWKIAINLFAKILMPTCTNCIKTLENIDQLIIVEDSQVFNDFLNSLQTLFEYGNEPELETLKMLSYRSYETGDTLLHVKKEDIYQLTETVKTLKIFMQTYNEAVVNASENEDHNQGLTTLRNDDLYFKFSPSVVKVTNQHENVYSDEINEKFGEKQLITCFTENIPKTFTVNKHTRVYDHRMHEIPCSKNSLQRQNKQIAQNYSNFSKQTKELMTQIDSPFYSAVAYCTNCSEFHEISLLSPFICKAELSTSNLNSSSEVSDTTSEVRLKAARSMPSLSIETKDSSVGEDRVSTFKNKKCSAVKKLSRSKGRTKRRPYSFNASLTETTASSGFDSPSESSIGTKEKISFPQIQNEVHRSRTGKRPFLWWYKRGKRTIKDESYTPESPNTEPGPPGRRSPLNMTTNKSGREFIQRSPTQFSEVNDHQGDFDEHINQSVVRSYSWIQQGTPWGYTPPSDSKWWPAMQILPAADREKNKSVNVHNDRSKLKTRKHVNRCSFKTGNDHNILNEGQMYNTIDSGIQTDIEMYISRQLDTVLFDAEAKNQRNHKNPESICQHCYKNIYKVCSADNSVQCNFMDDNFLSHKLYCPSPSRFSAKAEKSDNIHHHRLKSSSVKVWDVCCQVGVVKRNHSTDPIRSEDIDSVEQVKDNKNDSRIYAKYNGRSKSFETPLRRLSQSTNTPVSLKFSAACQIGTAFTTNNTVTSCPITENKEHRKVYCNQIGNTSSFTPCLPLMIGKKLQVGKPLAAYTKDISTQIQTVEVPMISTGISNIKGAIKNWLIESESSFISTETMNKIECRKEMLNNLTKTTDCLGLILFNETSTQIGLTNQNEQLSNFYLNQKDNSIQTDLPHIYVTETNIVPNWTSDSNEINEKFVPKSKTTDHLQTHSIQIKPNYYSESPEDNSPRMLINKSTQNKLHNYQMSATNNHQNILSKNIHAEQTSRILQNGKRESLNHCCKTTVHKLKKIHRNQTEFQIRRGHVHRRAISTCGDLIMNIELHNANCKHFMQDTNYPTASERLNHCNWLSLISSSSSSPSSSFEDYNDFCRKCRFKYHQPMQMNIEMITGRGYGDKSNRLTNHRSHHRNPGHVHRSVVIKRSLSADDSNVIMRKTQMNHAGIMKTINK